MKNESTSHAWRLARQRTGREYVTSLKAVPCADCGRTYPPECMDFDHVRGGKRRVVSQMVAWSRAAVDAEVAKCDLVCSNCHRIRTKNRPRLG
jgi:hypothetical protein